MASASCSPAARPTMSGDIRALAEVGVTAFDFGLFGPTLAATLDNMRRFKDEVMAKVR